MRTINILNAGYDDFHKGDIVDISGTPKAFNGRFYVDKVSSISIKLSEILTNNKIDQKPKKYKSTFIKSHKKVW